MSEQKMVLQVRGMTCGNCAAHVERALSRVPGVVEASVDLAARQATVTFVAGEADLADFKRAVAETGYQVL